MLFVLCSDCANCGLKVVLFWAGDLRTKVNWPSYQLWNGRPHSSNLNVGSFKSITLVRMLHCEAVQLVTENGIIYPQLCCKTV